MAEHLTTRKVAVGGLFFDMDKLYDTIDTDIVIRTALELQYL